MQPRALPSNLELVFKGFALLLVAFGRTLPFHRGRKCQPCPTRKLAAKCRKELEIVRTKCAIAARGAHRTRATSCGLGKARRSTLNIYDMARHGLATRRPIQPIARLRPRQDHQGYRPGDCQGHPDCAGARYRTRVYWFVRHVGRLLVHHRAGKLLAG